MRLQLLILCILYYLKISLAKLSNIESINDLKNLKKILKTRNNVLITYLEKEKSSSDVMAILDEVALNMMGKATVLRIICKDVKKLCKKMKASPSPLYIAHYKNGQFNREYDRARTAKSFLRFLEDPTGEAPWVEDPSAKDVVHVENLQDLQGMVTKNRDKPILLMLYVKWCGFCKKLKPEFAGAATELKTSAILAGMDVETVPEADKVFNITGYPTLYYVVGGEIRMKYGGENTKDGIVKWMKNPTAEPVQPKSEDLWSEEDNTDVAFLTNDNFAEFMKQHSSVLIMFYAPWCGHCKTMKPAYSAAATKLKEGKIDGVMAAVDATKQTELGKQFDVKGFPTVKYFRNGEFQFDITERTEEGLLKFMKDPKEPPPPPPEDKPWHEVPSNVQHLEASNFKSFLKKKKHVLVMFYAPWCGHCKMAKPEFMRAAEALKDNPKVALAAVDCTVHTELCASEEVKGYPTMKHFNYGKTGVDYTMGREEEEFIAFLTNPENPANPGQKRHWKTLPGFENVLLLDKATFTEGIASKEGTLVMFYAPWCGHCTAMKPALVEAAVQLKQELPEGAIAAVDATTDQSLAGQYDVKGFPTLIFFRSDGTSEKFTGGRTKEQLISFVKTKITGARKQAEEEKKRQEEAVQKAAEEKKIQEEAVRKAAEEDKKKQEEAVRKATEEKKRQEEARKAAEDEKKRKEEAQKAAEDEKKKQEEAVRKAKAAEAEAKRKEEEAKKKSDEEKQRREREEKERKSNEEAKRKEAEDKKKTDGLVSISSKSDFSQHIKTSRSVLVLFFRPSESTSSKKVESKFANVVSDLLAAGFSKDRVLLASVNCDVSVALCDDEEIDSSPIFRYYAKGAFKDSYSGSVTRTDIEKFLNRRFSKDEL